MPARTKRRGVLLIRAPDTFRQNSTFLIDEIVAPLNAAQIPFSSIQGVSTREASSRLAPSLSRDESRTTTTSRTSRIWRRSGANSSSRPSATPAQHRQASAASKAQGLTGCQ